MIRTDGRIGFFPPSSQGISLGATLTLWYETWRQRNDLAGLDARILADVGLTPDQARREAARPFWDVDR